MSSAALTRPRGDAVQGPSDPSAVDVDFAEARVDLSRIITTGVELGAGTAVLIALGVALIWVARRSSEQWLAEHLESHKQELARTQAEAIETLKRENAAHLQADKAKLDHIATRWSRRYDTFHEHRVQAMIELHGAIVAVRLALTPIFSMRPAGSGSVVDDAKKAGDKFNELVSLFAHKRLFLGDELAARHEQLMGTYLEIILSFTWVPESEVWKGAGEKWSKFIGEAQTLERAIRREYQDSLGASEERAVFEAPSPHPGDADRG